MKKKAFKGFTLIELLGTILILGIIALITTLVITNIIRDTKKSSIAISVKSYIATVNDNIISAKLRNENIIDGTYKILADGNICLGTYSNSTCNGDILDLNIDRGKPISGEIVIEDKKVTTVLNANINGEIISYDAIKNKEIVSDTVAINDFTATRFTNSIKLSFSPVNATSFKCEYGLTENYGSEGVINSSKTECIINDLKPGTLYYYRLTISKEANNSDSKKGALTTLPLSVNPTIILNPSGYSTSKTATITYSSGLENARLINPKYYFYTTSAGTSDIEVANCGTDFEPGECDVLKTTSLKANTWYKLDSDENITITYLINSTLIAKTVEDKTTVGSSQVLITTIDNNKPVIAVENIKYGETANIELYDNQSGIKFFAVTSENTLPSITSDTAGTDLNKWYQLENNTNQKITKEFTGLNVGVYYAWAKDELGNYENTRFVVEKANDTITIASIEKTYDKNTFTPNITTTSGLTTTNTYYTDNKCTQTVQNAINAGDYYVIATTTGNGNYKSTTSGCVKAATINKATIAANTTCEASKIYDGNSNANCTIAITNTVGNDTINATGTCSYNNANVGSNKTITCNSLALTGTNAVNYRLNDSTLTTTGNIYNAKLVFNPGDGVLEGTSPLYSRKGATSVYTEIANSTVGTIPIATRTNYTFTGWYTGDTKVINPDRSLVSDISNFTDSNGKWDLTSDQTLYAGWIASLYTITYNLDGGTVSQENPTTYTQSTPTFTLNNPTKAGYTFKGWSGTSLSGDTNTTVTINQGSTGNRSYTANWTLANYTIAYNLDGGTVTPENPTSYNTESSPIVLNNPTKAGYTFKGWSGTSLSGDTNTTVTIPTGSTGDRSYTANWTPTDYTITYNLDGGSATNPSTYNIETDTFTLNNPTKDGYTFKGWSGTSLSGDTNTTVTINQGSTGNRSYTANWLADRYTVTANANGGSIAATTGWSGTGNTATKQVTYDSAYGTLPTVSRTGYTFYGWYKIPNEFNTIDYFEATGSTSEYIDTGTKFNANTDKFELDFQANDSTGNYFIAGSGWHTNSNYIWVYNYAAGSQFSVYISDTSGTQRQFYGHAGPDALRHTVVYDSKKLYVDGTLTADNSSYTFGETPYNFTLFNAYNTSNLSYYSKAKIYSFKMWKSGTLVRYMIPVQRKSDSVKGLYDVIENKFYSFDNSAVSYSEEIITDSSNVITPSDHNLYAHWTPTDYTIVYDLGGGTVSPANPTSYNINSNTITLNNPTKAGYTFAGWTGSNDLSSGLGSYTTSSPYNAAARDHHFGNDFNVTAGTTYRVFVTAKRTKGSLDMQGGLWYTGQSSGYAYDGYSGAFVLAENLSDGWARYYKDVTVPAGKTKAQFYIQLNQTSDNYTTAWNLADISVVTGAASVSINKGSTGNRTYTANWTVKPVKIYYHPNGGTVGSSSYTTCNNGWVCTNSTTYFVQDRTYNTSGDLYNTTTFGISRAGYSIPDGTEWCTEMNGGGTCFDHDVSYSYDTYRAAAQKNLTDNFELDLYTHWVANTYAITLDQQSGSGGTPTIYEKYNTGYYTNNTATTQMTTSANGITVPTRTGYTFGGYYTSTNGGGTQYIDANGKLTSSASATNFTAAGTLYAKWTANTYYVTYDANSGSGAPAQQSFAYNSGATISSIIPTRTGYNFVNWKYSNGTQTFNPSDAIPSGWGSFTLIAQWSAINYTIGYDLKGGSATNPTSYNINSNAITLNNPTKSGFTFTGWSGTGLSGSANKSVTIPKGSTGNRSYTANWDKYNVTYNINRGQVSYVKSKNEYLDTGYIINWGRDFTITAKVSFSDTGRHQIIGNYYSTSVLKDFGLEFNADRKLRVWLDGAQRALSTGTVAANTDIDIVFTWNASTKQYTFTSTGTNSNASVSGTYNITGSSSYTLLMGTKDHRTGSATYSNVTVKSASITTKYPAGSTLSDLPTSSNGTSENYIFHGWFPYSNGTGTKPTTSTAVNNDLTYYGYWTNEVLYMTEPTASKSLVTGTGNTKTTGYETGTVFTFTCNGSSGHYPTSLQIKYNGTAASTKSNSSSTTYVLSNTYTLTSYASSASVTATCTDNTGKTANASATTRPAFRRFKLSYSGNGASLSGGDANNQYLLGDNTTQDGGHTVKLPTVSRGSAALGSNAYGLSTSSTTKSSSPTWGKTGPSVNIYYGTSASTSSIVYASDNYSAVRTLYGVSNVKILNPTKTASAANGTNATSDATYIYVWNSSTSVTYVNKCSSSLPHLTCLPQANSSGGAYDSAYKEICNGAGASCTASITNQYFIGGTSSTNCSWVCRANAGTG